MRLSALLLLNGCSFFEGVVSDALPESEFDVELIDQGPTNGAYTVDSLSFTPSLDPATPTYLSDPTTEDWGAALLFDSMGRAAGIPTVVGLTIDNLVIENDLGPFSLDVALVGSVVYDTAPGGGAPVPPAECHIAVQPGMSADTHAADVLACIQAWADANGVPADVQVSITAADRALGVFIYTGSYTMATSNFFEMDCERGVQLPDFVLEDAESLDVTKLGIAGYGGAIQFGLEMFAFANVFSPGDVLVTTASMDQRIESGVGYYVVEVVEVDPTLAGVGDVVFEASNVASIEYTPADEGDWTVQTYEAMVGDGPSAPGYADACWSEFHDDVPNSGFLYWAMAGVGQVQVSGGGE